MLCGMCTEPPAKDGVTEVSLSVMTYNILADELSSNLVPRTMEDPSKEVLQEILGPDYEVKWREVDQALNNEYRKWHPMKTLITDPQGLKIKSRGLWDQLDLTLLEGMGWQLDGVKVQDAVTLDGGKTFLGVVQQHMSQEQGLQLYRALEKVHLESRAWEARGPRILEKLKVYQPTFVAFQEYDVHDLSTGDLGTFREALEGLGYEGLVFLGPGQEKVGVAVFWLKSRAKLELELPEDRKLPCGVLNSSYGNIDLQEPGLDRPMDRRPLGYAKLLLDGVQVLFCVTHLMTSSRDKDGSVRKQELQTIRQLLETHAESNCPVILCGDFNINLRNGVEEHIFEGTGHQRDPESKAARFHWRRSNREQLVLRDAFDDVNCDPASSSTRTGTRLETIDYIFFDEQLLKLGERSLLQCPEEAMPNKDEPSDHIPVVATFVLR